MTAQNDAILHYLQPRLETILSDLAQLSGMDCGTYDKAGVDAVGRMLEARLVAAGAAVERHPDLTLGDSLVARWRGGGSVRVLLIGHLDTVYSPGWTAD